MAHYEPHFCPTCGLCWCACLDCKTSLAQWCVCEECPCDDGNHWHDDCSAWQQLEDD